MNRNPFNPRNRMLGAPLNGLVRRAQMFYTEGHYVRAAGLFDILAENARARRGPRAPFFYLQAGRSFLALHQVLVAVERFQQGLRLLALSPRQDVFQRVSLGIIQDLRQAGYAPQAEILHQEFLPPGSETGLLPPRQSQVLRPTLPVHCPSCGGPVDPREIEWIESQTAECVYCGTLLRGQGT